MKNKQKIRIKFSEVVFQRDNFKCCFCNEKSNLDAHHITDRNEMPNGGYVKENGISLCEKHHLDAEKYNISEGKEWIEGMHPNDLYIKIGSNFELALNKSKLLKK